MKRKKDKKFSLNKFEIAKLNNKERIWGGTGDDDTNTDTKPRDPNGPNNPQQDPDPDSDSGILCGCKKF